MSDRRKLVKNSLSISMSPSKNNAGRKEMR